VSSQIQNVASLNIALQRFGTRYTPPVQDCTPFVDCKVTVAGRLKANKGVNTPDVILPMSPITDKDRESKQRVTTLIHINPSEISES